MVFPVEGSMVSKVCYDFESTNSLLMKCRVWIEVIIIFLNIVRFVLVNNKSDISGKFEIL